MTLTKDDLFSDERIRAFVADCDKMVEVGLSLGVPPASITREQMHEAQVTLLESLQLATGYIAYLMNNKRERAESLLN